MIKLSNIRNIYVLGDLHLGVRNNSIEWFEIQKNFLLNFFIPEIKKAGFDPERDILIQVGDWNHVRESTNVRIWNSSLEIFKILSSEFKRGVYIILGNHDVYYKDQTHTHSLKGIDDMFENIYIFEKPEILEINGVDKLLLLPWIEKVDVLNDYINKAKNKVDYVFCHADIKGFQLNKYVKLEHGLDPSDLSAFKKIYAGHIHIRQNSKNMCYVGTPYQMDRGDRGNVKGFYVLDALDNFSEKFIENTVSPKYVKFDIFDILNSSLDEIEEKFKNNFVDLYLDGDFSKRFPITAFTELISKCKHRSLEFFTYPTNSEKSKSELDSVESYEYNIFDILKVQLDEKSLRKEIHERVSSKFNEIYNSLKNTKTYE